MNKKIKNLNNCLYILVAEDQYGLFGSKGKLLSKEEKNI